MAEQLDTDLNKKLAVINIIWFSCLLTVLFIYFYKSGYTLRHFISTYMKPGAGTLDSQQASQSAVASGGDQSTRAQVMKFAGKLIRDIWAMFEAAIDWFDAF